MLVSLRRHMVHESEENLKERGGYLDDVCEFLI